MIGAAAFTCPKKGVSNADPTLVTGSPSQFNYFSDDSVNRLSADALRQHDNEQETKMGFGRGALLWMLGVPLPIVIILALFMHH